MKNVFLCIAFFLCISLTAQQQNNNVIGWSSSQLFNVNKDLGKVNKIDIAKSSIEWSGSQLFKMNKHSGTVNIEYGNIYTKNLKVIGGDFVINMNTITNTDGKYNSMLVNHLKSDDFFSVNIFPEAKLSITKVFYKDENNIEVFANLTIKNVTNLIKFNGTVGDNEDNTILETIFKIDRTFWGINHQSKGVLNAVKDDIISNDIEFKVTIVWVQDKC